MGKAIVWALLILLAVGAWSLFWFYIGGLIKNSRITKAGGAGERGVTLLKEAREIFTEQTDPSQLLVRSGGSYDMLSEPTTRKINAWMQAYNTWRGKAS